MQWRQKGATLPCSATAQSQGTEIGAIYWPGVCLLRCGLCPWDPEIKLLAKCFYLTLFMKQNCVTTMLEMCFFCTLLAVPQNNHIIMFVCALQRETPPPLPCPRPPLSGSQTTPTSSPSSPCARPTSPTMTCATSRPAGRKPSRSASSSRRRRPSLSSTDGRWVAVPVCGSSSVMFGYACALCVSQLWKTLTWWSQATTTWQIIALAAGLLGFGVWIFLFWCAQRMVIPISVFWGERKQPWVSQMFSTDDFPRLICEINPVNFGGKFRVVWVSEIHKTILPSKILH